RMRSRAAFVLRREQRTTMKTSSGFKAILSALSGAFGPRLLTGSALERDGVSEGPHAGHLPEAVVQPKTVEEVQRLLALAHAHSVPITPFGAGTSLEGNAAAVKGGVCIDL